MIKRAIAGGRKKRSTPKPSMGSTTALMKSHRAPPLIWQKFDEKTNARRRILTKKLSQNNERLDELERRYYAIDGPDRRLGHTMAYFTPNHLNEALACYERVCGPMKKNNILVLGGTPAELEGFRILGNNATSINTQSIVNKDVKELLKLPAITGSAEQEIPKVKRKFDVVFSKRMTGGTMHKNADAWREIVLKASRIADRQLHLLSKYEAPDLNVFRLNGWETRVFEDKMWNYIVIMQRKGARK